MSAITLLWLRRDLRLADNPALHAAAGAERLLPVYIHAPSEESPWEPGAASRWWLHHSLAALDADLRARGSRLLIARGPSLATLRRLAAQTGASAVHWNRCYEPALIQRDAGIKQALRAAGLACHSHNAALLFEPWQFKTSGDRPYRVFSAYWRRCQATLADLPAPLPIPPTLPPWPSGLTNPAGEPLTALALLPRIHWDNGLAACWHPGEAGAAARLAAFAAGPAQDYASARDLPAVAGTSRLSPHLHFGEIGPRQVLAHLRAQAPVLESAADADANRLEPFLRELGWREFSQQLLYHFPATPDQPLDQRFARFPWDAPDEAALRAWQRGRTGIPIVDAGMRELWHSGWMHNRVRMLVASLLTKNLRRPWQDGARWFWDTLVDADLANNTQGWQWTAGCGADAAPYFRIFNPVRQGERFDPDAVYVARWCPELARLPARHRHAPWAAPAALLAQAGVRLGQDYPRPIVDLAASRQAALAAFEQIKGARSQP
ncbi:MAG: deoxyribodipyrimidine photo-lyase [Chromatiaceae bacterium]|nr:MAG: deoxyribodipyrimidine photo-lyase [Chromatiaceae bacterium]